MSEYAIGDIQGCFDALRRLLDHINFDEHNDRLWFVGDLVNRGPDSLAVLRFIKALPLAPRITLGNHDLHLLSQIFCNDTWHNSDDTLQEIIAAPDAQLIGHWLRRQSVIHYDKQLNVVMCHAGINPMWDLSQAIACAQELESALSGSDYINFLSHMYGNQPDHWACDLPLQLRLRVICNYFTRMRFCNAHGHLQLSYKGNIDQAPADYYPWFRVPNRHEIPADIIFGHWAALQGSCSHPRIHAIDTGCLWGGALTALRLEDKKRFSVSA